MSTHGEALALADVRRVRVGTANPPKLDAVRRALEAYAPAATVEGVAVESGVAEQPVGFDEIVRGARNRAHAALATGECDLAVGIEDGLVALDGVDDAPVFNIGCAIVCDGKREGMGLSSGFRYPDACVTPAVEQREPIGDLFDSFWREVRPEPTREASALSIGNVGKLSRGVLTRSEYARHAVICALVRFLHPDVYDDADAAAAQTAQGGVK